MDILDAGLVREPLDYRWSSCRLFLKSVESDTFVDYKFILQILDKDVIRARQKYAYLLKEAAIKEFGNILEDPKALESFRDKLIKVFRNIWGESRNDKDGLEKWLLSSIELEKKIEELSIKRRLRTPQELKARKFLIEQMRSRGFSLSEIAEKLKISRDSIYKTLKL